MKNILLSTLLLLLICSCHIKKEPTYFKEFFTLKINGQKKSIGGGSISGGSLFYCSIQGDTSLLITVGTGESIVINVKDSKKSWQKYLDKNKPDGIHLYADEEVSEKLYKELYINGIPRYVIVGKDGKLIESVAYPPIFVKESLTKAINSK